MLQSTQDIQAGLIQYLKGQSSVTSLLPTGTQVEIREAEWKGTDFLYPNVRVAVESNPDLSCEYSICNVTFEVQSEQKSSMEAMTIASAIASLIRKKSLTVKLPSGTTIHYTGITVPKVTVPKGIVSDIWQTKVQVKIVRVS